MAYADFVVALAELMGNYTIVNPNAADPSSDDDFNTILPSIIEYAEGRIYRDPTFDFLATRGALTATCAPYSRNITKPAALIVVEEVNLISPAGANPDDNASARVALERQSLDFINSTWPQAYNPADPTTVAFPEGYAALSDTAFRLGPTPDAAYVAEFVGTIRPAALSSANVDTFLTLNLPDLFLACAMVFACGFQKNFGAQSDNPQSAQSWENQFQTLKTGAAVEEARKKMQGAANTAYPPTTVANSPR